MVQFLLVQRGDQGAVPLLVRMASECTRPESRLQALCTLDGLKGLTPAILAKALHDSHPGVRRNAVRLCETFLKSAPELGEGIASLVDDADAQVRLQVACTLGEWDDPRAGDAIGKIALANQKEPYIFAAAMSSVTPKNLSRVAATVTRSDPGPNAPAELYRDLLTMATAYHNDGVLTDFIASTAKRGAGPYPAWELSAVAAMLDGLDQQKTTLSALSQRLGARGPATLRQLAQMAAYARQAAADPRAPLETRLAAVQILGRSESRADDQGIAVLGELLSPQTPAVLQDGVVAALGKLRQPKVADVLLAQWRSVGPALRSSILDVLISRDDWTTALLDHVEKKQINVHEIDIGRRQQLASLKNRALAERATKLLAASIDKDRIKVIERYHTALTTHANAQHGRQLFEKTCTVCHRLNDVGHSVGPELVALTDKSPQALLVAILDPNRAVEQKYVVYTAVTNQGRQYTGILAAETGSSITLLQQENKQTTILRGELEELSMPENPSCQKGSKRTSNHRTWRTSWHTSPPRGRVVRRLQATSRRWLRPLPTARWNSRRTTVKSTAIHSSMRRSVRTSAPGTVPTTGPSGRSTSPSRAFSRSASIIRAKTTWPETAFNLIRRTSGSPPASREPGRPGAFTFLSRLGRSV